MTHLTVCPGSGGRHEASTEDGATATTGTSLACACPETEELEAAPSPVCGDNNLTFASSCQARCSGVDISCQVGIQRRDLDICPKLYVSTYFGIWHIQNSRLKLKERDIGREKQAKNNFMNIEYI